MNPVFMVLAGLVMLWLALTGRAAKVVKALMGVAAS